MLGAIADNTALDLGVSNPATQGPPASQLDPTQIKKNQEASKNRVKEVSDETYTSFQVGQKYETSQIEPATYDKSASYENGGAKKGKTIDLLT